MSRVPAEIAPAWYDSFDEALAVAGDVEIAWLSYGDGDSVAGFIRAATRLRWLSTQAAGVENFPHAELLRRGILFTNGAGISAVPVAEFALLGMLALAKDFPSYVRAQDRRLWLPEPPTTGELAGSRALILGFGGLGRAIASRLHAFDVSVTGVRRSPQDEPGVIGTGDWRGRLGEFDWIVLTAPHTRDTHFIIDRAALAAMKRSARIVNMARGSLIDEKALVEALVQRRIAGAYLDVTDPEPAPAGAPIWSAPNVILSAHLSGSATSRIAERAGNLFADNAIRYLIGQPLLNMVDLS